MWLTHGAGKLRVALHTFTHVEYGCVLSYDYHCNTDDEAEYYNSKCLCGAQNCNTLYLSLAAGHFDAIMEENHTVLRRLAMLVRACECAGKTMSKRDAEALASVGFGKKIFRNSPLWLKCYCAQVIATHTQHTHVSHVTHCNTRMHHLSHIATHTCITCHTLPSGHRVHQARTRCAAAASHYQVSLNLRRRQRS
jgi:hypothetical protein